MYYLRSRAAADAIKFTVDTSILKVMIVVDYITFTILVIFDTLQKSIVGDVGYPQGGGGR